MKKTIRLNETQLINVMKKVITEMREKDGIDLSGLSYEDQRKLSNLDELIELYLEKVKLLKDQKKGIIQHLLQQKQKR